MIVKEIIVVEGKSDRDKVIQAVEADTIETNGSAIDQQIIARIKHAQQKRGVIIFTDPDAPGERIRHIIDQAVPGCKHAFLTRKQATITRNKHKSLGVEHASIKDIRLALENVYELTKRPMNEITQQDLMTYGLIGGPKARMRRHKLGELLHIGHTNGKQLLKRLSIFNITRNELDQTMERVIQEEEND